MIRSYFEHLRDVVSSHLEIKVGGVSSATGYGAYKLGEAVKENTVWGSLSHLLLILSIAGALFALFRGWYSFRKEWRKDRLEALKEAEKIRQLTANLE